MPPNYKTEMDFFFKYHTAGYCDTNSTQDSAVDYIYLNYDNPLSDMDLERGGLFFFVDTSLREVHLLLLPQLQ